jgi:hypothetical protein
MSASPTANTPRNEGPTKPSLTTDSISSHFADSGLGTSGLHTPSPKVDRGLPLQPRNPTRSPSKTTNSISSRLEQLAALAWEAEEDDRLDDHTRGAIQSQLHAIEAQLEGRTRGNEQTSSDVDLSNSASNATSSASSIHSGPETPVKVPEASTKPEIPDLNSVLEHLTATLSSMRTRLSESKHLHNLTIRKLSSVAQSNVNLQKTNTSLSHANAALRMEVADLETTTTQQAVAVSAMTGAVAGLESYVRSSNPAPGPSTPRNQQLPIHMNGKLHTPNSGVRRQTVIRGSGRFRGKYPITSPPSHLERRDSADVNMNLDGPSPETSSRQSELQEGILAWVRGFRDVEAGWREMDMNIHRTPTRFGNVTEIQDTPQTPRRRVEPEAERARSEEGSESVLLQGDKGSKSDIFGQDEEFGDFQTATSNG